VLIRFTHRSPGSGSVHSVRIFALPSWTQGRPPKSPVSFGGDATATVPSGA